MKARGVYYNYKSSQRAHKTGTPKKHVLVSSFQGMNCDGGDGGERGDGTIFEMIALFRALFSQSLPARVALTPVLNTSQLTNV